MLEGALIAPNTKNVKRVLRKGMQGNDVAYMQRVLNILNTYYRFCPNKSVKTSGYFGDETQNLLKFFQYWVGLDYWACYFEKFTCNALDKKYYEYMDSSSEDQLLMERTKKAFDDEANKPDPFDKY